MIINIYIGGGCVFDKSIGAKCKGGGCTFKSPPEVLLHGYCTGHNCNINGQSHPDLSSHLTI